MGPQKKRKSKFTICGKIPKKREEELHKEEKRFDLWKESERGGTQKRTESAEKGKQLLGGTQKKRKASPENLEGGKGPFTSKATRARRLFRWGFWGGGLKRKAN